MIINDTVTNILALVGLCVVVMVIFYIGLVALSTICIEFYCWWDKRKELKSITESPEILQGEWIKFTLGDFDFVDRYKCSLCDNIVLPATNHIDNFLYCSHCGAKMKGGANNGKVY